METKTETKKYKLTFHRSNASVDEWTEYKRYITSDVLVPVFTTNGKLRLAFGLIGFEILATQFSRNSIHLKPFSAIRSSCDGGLNCHYTKFGALYFVLYKNNLHNTKNVSVLSTNTIFIGFL